MAKARRSWITNYKQEEQYRPRNKKEKELIKVLVSVRDEKTMISLLRDLMTLPEIEEFANRLEIARLLLEGSSYLNVAEKTGTSTSTVTRVAHWLFSGCGGYQKVLKKK